MTFMSKEFLRKSKEDKPVVAICYDFDKTLSPDDMQAQGYINRLDMKSSLSGKNRTDWLKKTTWTKTLPICLQ